MKFIKMLVLALVATSFGAFADVVTDSNSAAQAGAVSGSGAIAGQTNSNIVFEGSNIPKQNYPVSSAAALMIQSCQDGASASGNSASVSIAGDSAVCQSLRMAAIHLEQYNRLFLLASATQNTEKAQTLYESANRELALYQEFLDDSDDAANFQYYPKTAGGAASAVLPVGLLGWLITLI